MKTLILNLTLLLFVLAGGLPALGQNRHEPSKERMQNIQNAKIAYITEKINLTPEQSQKFWPLYNQLENERNALREKSSDLRRVNLETISDADLRAALNNRLTWRQSELDLDKQYMDKFLRVISVRQLATLYRSEREFTKVLLKKMDAEHTARGNR